MFSWLAENWATILICGVVLILVAFAIRSLRKNKKQGKSSCGCGCADCAMCDSCHPKK